MQSPYTELYAIIHNEILKRIVIVFQPYTLRGFS